MLWEDVEKHAMLELESIGAFEKYQERIRTAIKERPYGVIVEINPLMIPRILKWCDTNGIAAYILSNQVVVASSYLNLYNFMRNM